MTVKTLRDDANASFECVGYGGLAIGNVTGADSRPAMRRMVELRKAIFRQQEDPVHRRLCTREIPCVVVEPTNVTHWSQPRTDMALLVGTISIEQPVCSRAPAPYHCTTDTVRAAKLRNATTELAWERVRRAARNCIKDAHIPRLVRGVERASRGGYVPPPLEDTNVLVRPSG